MTEETHRGGGLSALLDELPTDRLVKEAQNLARAAAERAVVSATEKAQEATGKLTEYVDSGGPGLKAAQSGGQALAEGKSPLRAGLSAGMTGLKEAASQALGGGSGGGGSGGKLKVTNLVEQTDVGVPIRLAYNQWTQFQEFPSFMKKVENVEQEADEKVNWKAQIVWSHRSWEATIIEQVPDDHITWHSQGEKGYVDGTVSFHELAPNLTRILLVLEYHPQGLFERTGNIWRAQGRRVRAEFKHFRRHVMTQSILRPDDIEGWRGEIRDGEVVRSHEEALEAEEVAAEEEEPMADEEDVAAEEVPASRTEEREEAEPDDEREITDEELEREEPEEVEPEPEPVAASGRRR